MASPRLSIGLPVYNGERHIAESLRTLLNQTFEDYELIISDNASTDSTPDICSEFERLDSRVRFVRQPHNIGMTPNHNFVVEQSTGEFFKWASHSDLYAPDLLQRCVEALDRYDDVMLVHSWTATIDDSGALTQTLEYPLVTASRSVPVRFLSLLFDSGGDDYYGVFRSEILRKFLPQGSYFHSDRTVVTSVGLWGPFYQVPDWLYFRRDHTAPEVQKRSTTRGWSTNIDPRLANRLRHPAARLYAEYIWGYVKAIRCAPMSRQDRRQCYRCLLRYLADRSHIKDANYTSSVSTLPILDLASVSVSHEGVPS